MAALLPPPKEEKPTERDWYWISSLAVLIIAGLIAAFAGVCHAGIFPVQLLGGLEGTLFTLFGAGMIAAMSGILVYMQWQKN